MKLLDIKFYENSMGEVYVFENPLKGCSGPGSEII